MTHFLKGGLAAAMLASTIAATPAIANDAGAIAIATVEYGDLDLSSEQGQRQFHLRYREAAQYVCGMDIRDAGTRLPSREARACYAEKMRGADRQLAMLVEAQERRA